MFKRFIKKLFGCNCDKKIEQGLSDIKKQIATNNACNYDKKLETNQSHIKANLREHTRSINMFKQSIKTSFDNPLSPSDKLSARERLALDYAKELVNQRVLYYPEKLKLKTGYIGGRRKTKKQHWQDAAKESLLFADRILQEKSINSR